MTNSPARPSAAGFWRMTSSRGARTCGAFPRSTPNTSPAWRMCSISTTRSQTQSARSSASTKARPNSSARRACPFPPGRDSWSVSTANIGATARPISLSSSTPTDPGAGSRSQTGGRRRTSQAACAISSTSTSQTPRKSASCSTTCRHTRQARSTRPFRRRRRGAFCAASSSTTPQGTQAGSTWWRSRSASCATSASIAASTAEDCSSPKSPPGNSSETAPAHPSIGCSPQKKPASKWPAPIRPQSMSHNLRAEVLAGQGHPLSGPGHIVRSPSSTSSPLPSTDRRTRSSRCQRTAKWVEIGQNSRKTPRNTYVLSGELNRRWHTSRGPAAQALAAGRRGVVLRQSQPPPNRSLARFSRASRRSRRRARSCSSPNLSALAAKSSDWGEGPIPSSRPHPEERGFPFSRREKVAR